MNFKKFLLYVLISGLPAGQLNSQSVYKIFTQADSVLNVSGYQAARDFLIVFGKNHLSDSASPQEKSFFYQACMTFYSFCGDNKNSIEFQEKAFPRSHMDVQYNVKNIRVTDFAEYLSDEYGKSRILLFNEAHNRGQNRSFIRDLLPVLKLKYFFPMEIED